MNVRVIRWVTAAALCSAVVGCNLLTEGGRAKAPSQEAAESTPEAAPKPADDMPFALSSKLIANNPALIKALAAKWTPDESGSIPASTDEAFEKELVRSVLYVNEGPGARREADKLYVYTDEASVKNAEGPGARPTAVEPALVLGVARVRKQVLYVMWEEGGKDGGSFFTALDEEVLPRLHELAKKSR